MNEMFLVKQSLINLANGATELCTTQWSVNLVCLSHKGIICVFVFLTEQSDFSNSPLKITARLHLMSLSTLNNSS